MPHTVPHKRTTTHPTSGLFASGHPIWNISSDCHSRYIHTPVVYHSLLYTHTLPVITAWPWQHHCPHGHTCLTTTLSRSFSSPHGSAMALSMNAGLMPHPRPQYPP